MSARQKFNPLGMLAAKQKIGPADADRLALPALLYLDAAKRGKAHIAAENGLVFWVVLNQCIAGMIKNKAMDDMAKKASSMLLNACRRAGTSERDLDLTTTEYLPMKGLMAIYLRVLPLLEVWQFAAACQQAEGTIDNLQKQYDNA